MRVRWASSVLVSAALGAVLLASACGSGEASGNASVNQSGPGATVTAPNASPISNATPAGSRTAAAGGSGSQEQGKPESIVATDNKWDKTTMAIQSGTAYTVTMQNKGAALHNWHVTGVKGADGKDITTAIIGGGQNASVTFTISQKGSFDYICDVHPVEMKGKLNVQ